jgi:thiamine monophosphate synthase
MSKFIERLQQVFQPPVQAMGFKAAKTAARPKIQLIVNISGSKAKALKEIEEADALLLNAGAAATGEVFSGNWLINGDAAEMEKAEKAGVDFVVVPVTGKVTPQDKKLGKILLIESTVTDIMLRAASALPVDAVLLGDGVDGDLTINWKRLMVIHRFAGLGGKPLLVEVLPSASAEELQQIWEAGVSGIVVKADAEEAQTVAHDLRQVIEKLTFPAKKKNEKNVAMLPHIAAAPEEHKEDDDGDDDDGDDE